MYREHISEDSRACAGKRRCLGLIRRMVMVGILCIFGLTGCGKNHAQIMDARGESDKTSEYSAYFVDVPENMIDGTRYYLGLEDKLVKFNCQFTDENGIKIPSVTEYIHSEQTFEQIEIDLKPEIISNADLTTLWIYDAEIYPAEDGYAVLCSINDTGGNKHCFIDILDENYQVVKQQEVEVIIGATAEITADIDGNIAVMGTDFNVRVYDSNLENAFELENPTGESYLNMGTCWDGMYVQYECLKNYKSEPCYYLAKINVEEQCFEPFYLCIDSTSNPYFQTTDTTSDYIYISHEEEVCLYHFGDSSTTKICTLTDYGISSSLLKPVVSLGAGVYVYGVKESGMDYVERLFLIEYNPDGAGDTREKITYAVTGTGNTTIQEAIMEFNREHEDCYIAIRDYSGTEKLEQLRNEIANGEIPDFIDMSALDTKTYAEQGLLAEVGELAQSLGMTDRIYEAMCIDGALYEMIPSYYISCMLTRQSAFDETDDAHPGEADLEAIMNENGMRRLYVYARGAELVLSTIRNDEQKYLNGEPDTEELAEMLELAKKYDMEQMGEYSEDVFIEGKALFCPVEIRAMDTIWIYREALEGDLAYMGYSCEAGLAPAAIPNAPMALSAESAYAKEYEELWKIILPGTEEEPGMVGLPVTDGAVEAYFDRAKNEPYQSGSSFGSSYVGYHTADWTREDRSYMEAFLNSISTENVMRGFCGYEDIIIEETQAYIDGEQTARQAAEAIRNRLAEYLQE